MAKILVSTAEVSADLHAARLVSALRRQCPDLTVDAAGGRGLADAGANLLVDMTGRAVMGFWEVFGQLSFYRRAGNTLLRSLEEGKYDALVVVDAPSFHLRLVRQVRERWPGLPILYYIPPKLWAWKEWRVKAMRRDISRTLCIFPFEVEFFGKRGVDAVYVGNPSLDALRDVDGSKLSGRLRVGLPQAGEPSEGIMAVCPGSRKSEIKYIWPRMAGALGILTQRFPRLRPVVGLAPGMDVSTLRRYAPIPVGVETCCASQQLIASASVVMAKSGTTTLEAALLGKPMVVCYAGAAVSYWLARCFVSIGHVSLPNILAERGIVRELLQDEASPENLAGEISTLLTDAGAYRKMREELLGVRQLLGDVLAAERAAREVLGCIGGTKISSAGQSSAGYTGCMTLRA